jgi:DNA-binding protein HU-beta
VNKSELITAVNEKMASGTTPVDAVLQTIQQTLSNGNEVKVMGFGVFSIKDRPARTGRNPKTGAPIEIAPSTQVKFKPSADFLNKI